MVGNPMPPVPDEPPPRYVRRPEEQRPWSRYGLYLGESDICAERRAAMRAAVEIARMMRSGQ